MYNKILPIAIIASMAFFATQTFAAERAGGGFHGGGVHGGEHMNGGAVSGEMHGAIGHRRGAHRAPGGWYNEDCDIVPFVPQFYYYCPYPDEY